MPRKAPKNQKVPRRLMLDREAAMATEWHVPTWWLNSVIGLFLLAPALLLTQTFFTAFSRVTLHQQFWATEEFWFFALGSVLWTLWFFGSMWAFGEPRPLRVYIFGHELTHAVWVWLMGGAVEEFVVRRDGGHILTDKHNFWISLTPYFYPLYSLVIIALYGLGSLFYNLADSQTMLLGLITPLRLLFLALGFTWAFHMSFTCWMIPKGQSDLTRHGTFFSLVVIYSMNLVLLAVFLIVAAPEITLRSFGLELLGNTEDASALVWNTLIRPLLPANSL